MSLAVDANDAPPGYLATSVTAAHKATCAGCAFDSNAPTPEIARLLRGTCRSVELQHPCMPPRRPDGQYVIYVTKEY